MACTGICTGTYTEAVTHTAAETCSNMLTHTAPPHTYEHGIHSERRVQRMRMEKYQARPRRQGEGLTTLTTQLPWAQHTRTPMYTHTHTHTYTHTHTHTPWPGTTYFIGTFGSRATRNQDLVLGKKAPLSAGTGALGAAAAFPRTGARPVPRFWVGRSGGARAEGEGAGARQALP